VSGGVGELEGVAVLGVVIVGNGCGVDKVQEWVVVIVGNGCGVDKVQEWVVIVGNGCGVDKVQEWEMGGVTRRASQAPRSILA